jgi:beta-fructofuranosidase
MLALETYWVWDSWYLHDGTRWHCWYLKAPKSIGDPAERHWNVSQGHAVSDDLKTWRDHDAALSPSKGPAWDDYTTWTGSVLRGDDGVYHYFYTGTSRAEDGKIQRIGHATGADLIRWDRAGDGLCLDLEGPNAALYETAWQGRWHDRAMRDPWVMKDPHTGKWLMYFTARANNIDEINAAGCIGLATSDDLYHWHLEPPVHVGGWGQLEVPQVFEHSGTWYCLFCMTSDHQSIDNISHNGCLGRGNHYLIGESPRGPWRLPAGAGLDTQAERYAARIVDHNGLKILGFKDGEERGAFGGYIMDPQPVRRLADGTLTLEA